MRGNDSSMKVTIDRFEGGFAVVETEDGKFVNLPSTLVPAGAKEGSVLSITLDDTAAMRRRGQAAALVEELWKD
jgi:hypothetical protein